MKQSKRLGFGKVVIDYTCPKCQKVTRLNKNWKGPTPKGGFECECGQIINF